MRIIAGTKKGLKLQSPATIETRPTMDRTKENIMNILENGIFKGRLHNSTVADVFAGSGSVGLEMLSRGASHCTFFENNPITLKTLHHNIKKFNAQKNQFSVKKNALTPHSAHPFDIVFMDAPYNQNLTKKSLHALYTSGCIHDASLLIIQVSKEEDIPERTPFIVRDERVIGNTRFAFLAV